MNTKLVESLAQVILALSEEERSLLYSTINVTRASHSIQAEILELENRLEHFESQYQMSSDTFYQRFHSGELGDAIDFFEWCVFYEMWSAAQKHTEAIGTKTL
ncbi:MULTISPECIES: hypothetical protein [unclassified Coleofasciculus]|uniref:hypothetical protein n=1 Tax=unclassified Coleofasciculus TaxID=2692782 RepID=UPI00187E5124|nr:MULTISPECIES: hypothetical protein [unclassified Coleofasciculus]MBE9128562.1 hypothetical protein [Coleofasciculus sp. LEGE 07081]MBE9149358.1 hypothetical protein [Coleofasciculus sp. LEGE 07092]